LGKKRKPQKKEAEEEFFPSNPQEIRKGKGRDRLVPFPTKSIECREGKRRKKKGEKKKKRKGKRKTRPRQEFSPQQNDTSKDGRGKSGEKKKERG